MNRPILPIGLGKAVGATFAAAGRLAGAIDAARSRAGRAARAAVAGRIRARLAARAAVVRIALQIAATPILGALRPTFLAAAAPMAATRALAAVLLAAFLADLLASGRRFGREPG
jgi:hypothetical protein